MRQNKASCASMDLITVSEAVTLDGLFRCRVRRSPSLAAYHHYDRNLETWTTLSWQEMGAQVEQWRQGLAQEDLVPGERVAILMANSVEWVCFEQAALAQGLVVVPLYTWDSPENIGYILRDSGSSLLLCGSTELWRGLIPHMHTLPGLRRVLCLADGDALPAAATTVPIPVRQWLPQETDPAQKPVPEQILDPDGLATIIYTSGTTGPPKGVMLSHRNILWNTEAVLKVVPCYPSDLFLSFLPLSHTFERTVGYYTAMMGGSSVAYSRSIQELAEDLQTIRPTIIISVPRIYERVYSKIHKQLQQKGWLARSLFQLAVDIGWKKFQASQNQGACNPVERYILWPLLKRLVGRKVLNRLGGRIRLAISGGAPLQESVSRFFLGLGLPLLQGYGLTEAAPVVSANSLAHNIPTSVGPPLPGVQCRIGRQEELLVKSPGIMLGYWNLPDKTHEVIDPEGWLHTGDVARINEGLIIIKGRLKEIIVTSTGEKIPPADLEMALCSDPLIDHALVLGEGRPYLIALLVLHPGPWQELAKELGLDPQDPASLDAPAAQEALLARTQGLLHAFPVCAKIRALSLLLDEWTIENGLLTPTFKVKRQEVEQCYSEKIKDLYLGHELVD